MLRKLIASDEAVKLVFDHFRNIGIAGAVLAAGLWTIQHPVIGLLGYMSLMSGGALCVLGVFLLYVAERHGRRKFQSTNLAWYWEAAVVLVYALGLFALFAAAALRIELH